MKNYVQEGDVISIVATQAMVSGTGYLVGTMFGIAQTSGAIGDPVSVVLEGVVTHAKAAVAVTLGAKLYWDDTAKVVTTTVSTNVFVGYAFVAALSGDATVTFKLQTV